MKLTAFIDHFYGQFYIIRQFQTFAQIHLSKLFPGKFVAGFVCYINILNAYTVFKIIRLCHHIAKCICCLLRKVTLL